MLMTSCFDRFCVGFIAVFIGTVIGRLLYLVRYMLVLLLLCHYPSDALLALGSSLFWSYGIFYMYGSVPVSVCVGSFVIVTSSHVCPCCSNFLS